MKHEEATLLTGNPRVCLSPALRDLVETSISLLPTEEAVRRSWVASAPPVVSVVCTTYNHEAFIADAFAGFLVQDTSFPFEIIVADDSSSDATLAVLAAFKEAYPTIIRILAGEPERLGYKRNGFRAFAAARGRYIAFCEGDDYWRDPHKLQTQVDFLEQNPDYVLTYHNSLGTDASGAQTQDSVLSPEDQRDWSAEDLICYTAIHLPTATLCFRHVSIDFPPEWRDLVIFPFLSLLGHHGKAKYQGQIAPSVYRRHSGGVWSALAIEQKRLAELDCLYMMFVYYRRLSQHRYASRLRREFISLALGISTTHTARRPHASRAIRVVTVIEKAVCASLLSIEEMFFRIMGELRWRRSRAA